MRYTWRRRTRLLQNHQTGDDISHPALRDSCEAGETCWSILVAQEANMVEDVEVLLARLLPKVQATDREPKAAAKGFCPGLKGFKDVWKRIGGVNR